MTTDLTKPVDRRIELVYLFDVTDGNPNGNPDDGNQPRYDHETGQGLVSPVSIKRKLRDYWLEKWGNRPGYDIFVQPAIVLNPLIADAVKQIGAVPDDEASILAAGGAPAVVTQLCGRYADVRTWGGVLGTGVLAGMNGGQLRGPVQLGWARSVDRVTIMDHSLHRVTVASEKEADDNRHTTFGHQYTIPYGLYRMHGFVNPQFAMRTGFSWDDLGKLYDAMEQIFDYFHASCTGEMHARALIEFQHNSALGACRAASLFDGVRVSLRKDEADGRFAGPARSFASYQVQLDNKLPPGITRKVIFCDDPDMQAA